MDNNTRSPARRRPVPPPSERSEAPANVPHEDYQPSRVRQSTLPENTSQQAASQQAASEREAPKQTGEPALGTAEAQTASGDTAQVHTGTNSDAGSGDDGASHAPTQAHRAPAREPAAASALFQEASGFMDAHSCTLTFMIAPADSGKVRLTILGQRRHTTAEDEEAPKKDSPSGPPFKPITVEATPEQLDNPENGLRALLAERSRQAQSLTDARARADKAHEQAVEAEERREKKAKARKEKASENGPLFSDADSNEEDSSGDGSSGD